MNGGAALLTQLQRAYDGLIAAQPPPDTALAKLTTELATLDARHDACVRGLLYRLDAEIVIAESDATKQALEALRDALFPTGAAVVQRSYVEEAGEAKLRDARLTAAMRKTLAKLKTLDGRTGEALLELLQVQRSRARRGRDQARRARRRRRRRHQEERGRARSQDWWFARPRGDR